MVYDQRVKMVGAQPENKNAEKNNGITVLPLKSDNKNAEKNDGATIALSLSDHKKTSQKMATELGISERTVRYDVAYGRAVKSLSQGNKDIEDILVSEDFASKKEITALAKLPEEKAQKILAKEKRVSPVCPFAVLVS